MSGSQTNASDSTYTATASSLSNSNYKLPSAKTKSFTISKRPLTITAAAQTVICDGTIDTGTNKVSAPNLVSGHRVTSITLTPSDVSAPTTTGTITPSSAVIKDAGENTVTSNYNITYANGTLTVINCTHTSLTAHPEEQPTLTSIGHVAYWTCDDCGKKFSDSLGANEINTVPALYKVVYSANGGSGTMADSVAQIGDRLTLPACGFSAPANKQFDHWEVSGLDQICAPAEEINVASNICVGSVITVTAKWRDAAAPYTPPTYSTPTYDTTASTPILPGGGGWDTLSTVIESIPSGGSLEINMNGTTTLPAVAIDAIKDKDVNLVLDMGNGIKWTVNGKNITNAAGDINMGVYLGASGIPVDVINRLTGQRERVNLMLANAGGPGFMATLTVPLRKEWTGLFANLFNYNRITKNMDFVSCGQINPDGNADLIIGGKKPPVKTAALGKQNSAVSLKLAEDDETSQASSTYTIVVDDHSLDPTITAEPTPSPSVEDATKIKLTASSKGGQVILSWNKIKNAKKYRVYQSVGGKNKLFREFKKTTLIVKKAFAKGKNKEMLKIGKKYKFSVTAYVNGKWTKITKASTKTIKVK